MPHARQRSPQQVTEPAATHAGATGSGQGQRRGNAAAQGQLAQLGDLYAVLRARVGASLADLITSHLSEDDLLRYAEPALAALMDQVRAAAAASDTGLSDAELTEALTALDTSLTEGVTDLIGSFDLDGQLALLARDQPEVVLAAVLAGVVLWALTNPDLPELSLDRDLGGGHTLGGSLDLGRLQELTVQHIEARWGFQSERTEANARAFGGEREGGWGAEGAVSHTLGGGSVLGAEGRYFQGADQREARGRLSLDGARTDASVQGLYRGGAGGDQWGLGALLTHDGERTDARLEGSLSQGLEGGDAWLLGGELTSDTSAAELTRSLSIGQTADGGRRGHVGSRLVDDHLGWRRHIEARASLDGAWSGEAGVQRTDGDRVWALAGGGGREAAGPVVGHVRGSWADQHGGFSSAADGRVATDGTWNATGGLTGTDPKNPWSLTGEAGRTSTDGAPDWSVTGSYGRALDRAGDTMLTGTQMVGAGRSLSRLQLDHTRGDTTGSAWIERSRTAAGTVDALGGSLSTKLGDGEAYARGWVRSDDTWEATAGLSSGTEEDDFSVFAEGFTRKDLMGEQDTGVSAGLRWRF